MGVHWKRSTVINDDFTSPTGLCVSVASSVGVGVFLIVGYVAKHVAGPAAVVSVLITATIAILTGLFYAELQQRLPRKASPYTFSHVCIGRLAAFVTGWTLLLEYVVAVALVAKGVGLYIDALLDEALTHAFREIAPIRVSIFGEYFDLFGFAVALVIGAIFLVDFRRFNLIDNAALAICLAAIIFIITTGGFNANPVNWEINNDPANEIPSGFLPFGVLAIFKGAAMYSFAFIAVESLFRPKRTSIRSVSYVGLVSFSMILVSLVGCSVVLTLMWPHNLMHANIPLPHAFADYEFRFAKLIVSIVAIVILAVSLWTLMFPLKRQIIALAEDGLLPFVESNRRALSITLLLLVAISSLMSGCFSMGQLINLLSVGTLFMFVIIAVAILMLRFSNQLDIGSISTIDVGELKDSGPTGGQSSASWRWMRQVVGLGESTRPTSSSFWVIKITLIVELCAMIVVSLLVRFANQHIYALDPWALGTVTTFALIAIICWSVIALQPMRTNAYYFKVPVVSVSASISMFVCVFLIAMLEYVSWARFGIWLVVGVPVYLASKRKRGVKPKWRFTGISKIQGMHNRGFVVDPIDPYTTTSSTGTIHTANQMEEITHFDESEQLDVYAQDRVQECTQNNGSVILNTRALEVAAISDNVPGSKSRTPSPSSSLDDIVPACEIIDSLSERKEPNGKIYYVDDVKTHVTEDDSRSQTDYQLQPNTDLQREHESHETIADIHTAKPVIEPDMTPIAPLNQEEVQHSNHPEAAIVPMSIAKETSHDSLPNFNYEQQLKDLDSESDDNELPAASQLYHDDNNTDSDQSIESTAALPSNGASDLDATTKQFKERLSMLLMHNRPLDRQPSISSRNVTVEPDIKRVFHLSNVPDDELYASSRVELPRVEINEMRNSRPTNIPPPPVFDAHLYNSHGGSAAQIPSPDYDGVDEQPDTALSTHSDGNNHVIGANINNNDDTPNADSAEVAMRTTTFRKQLERILSKGPSVRTSSSATGQPVSIELSKPKEIPHTQITHITEDDSAIEPAEEQSSVKHTPKSQHRQMFGNVLNAINNYENRTSTVPRQPSPKPVTIADARMSLRHVPGTTL